jgi:hypothetical protein
MVPCCAIHVTLNCLMLVSLEDSNRSYCDRKLHFKCCELNHGTTQTRQASKLSITMIEYATYKYVRC